jgi:hypothetical protein
MLRSHFFEVAPHRGAGGVPGDKTMTDDVIAVTYRQGAVARP